MTRQYLVAIGFVVITGCAAIGIPSLYPPPEAGISHGNFERVKLGMTPAEVEDILGRPTEVKTENGTQFQTWTSRGGLGSNSSATIEFRDGFVIHREWSEDQRYHY